MINDVIAKFGSKLKTHIGLGHKVDNTVHNKDKSGN